ncbi:MAG: hypothetical protein CNLJKLNK_01313 [Holosporales bacterium]
MFYDHHEPQNASGEDCYLNERIKKTEALQSQAESQGRFDDAEVYAEIASRLYAKRPPSPILQDTAGRQAAHRFNDRFIPNFVKKGVHSVGQEIHDFGQYIDDRFNAFLKNPSLKTFQDAELTLKALKEGLGFAGDVICTTVDYGKSVARRGLRFAGVDANIAQDLVNAAEIATYVAPVMSGAYVAATSTKIGVKTASAFRSAVHEISAATRFGLDVLEDYAQFKARGPQLAYARSRTFDRTFSAPKRAHSSIVFQQRTSYASGVKASAAAAAPRAQQAPAAAAVETKVGVENVAKKPVTAYDFKDYIREIESVSGIQIPSEQKAYLAQMLRENNYTKIQGSDLVAHRNIYRNQRAKLIENWETMGGDVKVREWPTYLVNGERLGAEAHHIIPQQYKGLQDWRNIHPVKVGDHQRLIHGSSSELYDIIKRIPQIIGES